MIVRILGEGQLEVDSADLPALNALDDDVTGAVEAGDEDGFRAALSALLGKVREVGSPLEDGTLVPSELVLPSADASLPEVRALLTDEGLIPG